MPRLLLVLVLLTTVGLGCRNPFAKPEASPTSVVPTSTQQEEDVEPGIFRQTDPRGFSFDYPAEMVVPQEADDGDLYTVAFGPTVYPEEEKKSVPDLTLHVFVVPSSDFRMHQGCYLGPGWNSSEGIPTAEEQIAGRTSCLTEEVDAAAGNRYHTRSYAIPHRGTFIVFRFTVHSVECMNYDNPTRDCIAFDTERDFAIAERVVKSIRFDEGAWKGFSIETHTLEKKLKYAEYSVSYPEIVPEGNDVSLRSSNELTQNAAGTFVVEFENDAKEITAEDVGVAGAWTLDVGGEVSYLSEEVVSTIFRGSIYTGGAHPNAMYDSVLVDRKTGKELTLNDLFVDPSRGMSQLVSRVRAKIALLNDVQEFSDEDWIKMGTDPTPENYSIYGFTDEGLLIIFAPYQIAAYAAGSFDVVIPWSELPGLVKERFIQK